MNEPLNEQETLVLGLLQYRSRARAISMDDLAAVAGVSTRTAQQIVKDLIEHHAAPIGSVSSPDQHGYFWIEDQADLDAAVTNLRNRALSCLRRIARLKRATPSEVLGQLALELADDGDRAA